MGDNTFVLAADGWMQVTPCGEFPHAGAGVVQVIDRAACDAIAADFNARKADDNFPGVLFDFDHVSLDTARSGEAAGWIAELKSAAGSASARRGGTKRFRPYKWWQGPGSNRRHADFQSAALPTELPRPKSFRLRSEMAVTLKDPASTVNRDHKKTA